MSYIRHKSQSLSYSRCNGFAPPPLFNHRTLE